MLRTRAPLTALLLVASLLPTAPPAIADLTLPTDFRDATVYTGLTVPVAMAFLPGPPEKGTRVLVLE